jgi:hypothetical protein
MCIITEAYVHQVPVKELSAGFGLNENGVSGSYGRAICPSHVNPM